MSPFVIGALVLLGLAAVCYGYYLVISKHLSIANAAMDKQAIVDQAQGTWAKLDARLLNLKTIILGFVSSITGLYSIISTDTLQAWGGLPWASVVDQKVASWISFACAALVPIVHAQGVARAAKTEPNPAVEDEGR